MSFAFKLGRVVGGTAARVVHYGEVGIEATGHAGKDFVQGTKQGYTGDRAALMLARGKALQQRAEALARRAEPVAVPAPAVAPAASVIVGA